mmetsp:Transcript_3351/g.4963  ORF Transcript_3351/g.4963 Transcript_3351/m.4963 type:complete len:89 (-) Transcript_3351:29-295(-)
MLMNGWQHTFAIKTSQWYRILCSLWLQNSSDTMRSDDIQVVKLCKELKCTVVTRQEQKVMDKDFKTELLREEKICQARNLEKYHLDHK